MGNYFGTSSRQVALYDPRNIRTNRGRFRRAQIPQLDLANSLYVPADRTPARGWILLRRADYDAIRGYGTSYQLQCDEFDAAAPAQTFKNLSIVQARCVTTGLSASPDAIYLVELTDFRGVLKNRWFERGTVSYYNVLAPAYPTLYYSASLTGGVVWTWSTLVQDLWTQLGLGTYPGLPSAPTGTPRNWNLPGVSAWDALCDILDHLGMSISVDLTSGTPYGIVSLGAADAAFDALTTRYAGRKEDDLEWIDAGAGRVPGTVVVYFHVKYEQYGTEETVRRDGLQWATNTVYPVSVSAPAAFTGAVGTHYLWDDFVVRLDVNGTPLAADVITAAAIAAERVTQFFDLIYSRTTGSMNRTYTGVIPFTAGSQVDGVAWIQDFAESRRRQGWITQVLRGELWPEVFGR